MSVLRRTGGAPVSYAELRRAGVELPASVVSELQLQGVPIEHCHGVGGVRLEPAVETPSVTAAPTPSITAAPTPGNAPTPPVIPESGPVPSAGRPRSRRPRAAGPDRRLAAPLALVAMVAVVAVILVVALTSGGGQGGAPTAARRAPAARARTSTAVARVTPTTRSTPESPAPPVSPAVATALEARGHGLLENGEYSDAVSVLRDAVLATGMHLSTCLDPVSSTCLTYAYALYDLGRALRLSGDPSAAVPVLERRLQIDNQRPTVEAELQLARQHVT
jgi:hypothetical protein